MDNQQGKTDLDLSWLAGFFDGEGCFHMRKSVGTRLRSLGVTYYRPTIRVCNTHEPTLNVVAAILDAHQLPYHVSWRKYTNPKYLAAWDLEVSGIKRCAHWLPVILPYLHTKREQAERLLEFCESRLSKAPSAAFTAQEDALLLYFRRER